MKVIYVLVWTYGNHEVVPTKKAGMERCRAWKEEMEAQGWRTRASRGYQGYVAYAPGHEPGDPYTPGPDAPVRSMAVVAYDSQTKLEIRPKLPPLLSQKPPKPERARAPRRGRKPVGV